MGISIAAICAAIMSALLGLTAGGDPSPPPSAPEQVISQPAPAPAAAGAAINPVPLGVIPPTPAQLPSANPGTEKPAPEAPASDQSPLPAPASETSSPATSAPSTPGTPGSSPAVAPRQQSADAVPNTETGPKSSSVKPWKAGDPVLTAPAAQPAGIGVNYHGMWRDQDDAATRAGILDTYAAAGVSWVRMDVAWATLQPNRPGTKDNGYDMSWGVPQVDQRIQEIAARGMRAVIVIYWPPQWSSGTAKKNGQPAHPADYGNLLGWAANRWHQVDAWEMWNEPDLSSFWHSKDPVQFAGLLKGAYPVAKAAAPGATFIAGAPTYVGTNWYRQLFASGAGGMFDDVAIHPYMGEGQDPQAKDDGTPWVMDHIASLIKLLAANGESGTGIWATEFGWSVHPNTGKEQAWDKGVNADQQSDYLLKAMDVMGKYPQVKAAFWYTDRDTAVGDIQQDRFGLLTRSLQPRPAFYALKCAASRICGPSSSRPAASVAVAPRAEPGPAVTPSPTASPIGSANQPAEDIAAGTSPEVLCHIDDPRLRELSGLASSLAHPGIVYAHNDSGDIARVFAIDEKTCSIKTEIRLRGVTATDFEAISVGRSSSGTPVVWVGDTGDNGHVRKNVTLYSFAEPAELVDQDVAVSSVSVTYADGPRDCESLLVSQVPGGPMWLVSKEDAGGIYALSGTASGSAVANRVSSARPFATDAALSPDGTRLVVRSGDVGTAMANVMDPIGRKLHFPTQRQGEAITYTLDGKSVLIASEGVGDLIRVPLASSGDGPPP